MLHVVYLIAISVVMVIALTTLFCYSHTVINITAIYSLSLGLRQLTFAPFALESNMENRKLILNLSLEK